MAQSWPWGSQIAVKKNYFPAEEESVCTRKKMVNVSSTGHNLDASF